MAARDNAASINGLALRITPLKEDGAIDTTKPILTTNGFISLSFSSEFEDGDEITEKGADGAICIQFKNRDSMKGITVNLSLCSPDPEAAALLAGGKVICDPATGEIVGYSSPKVGDVVGNPVALEVWSRAIVGGKPASGQPYWHWVLPFVQVRFDGDREFANGALANEFSGTGVGNDALVPTGLNPLNLGDDYVKYKAALTNPFSYVRSAVLPALGWSGSFVPTADNSIGCGVAAVTPTGVVPGTPGQFTPLGADVPDNLAALQALGAFGQTTAWKERLIGTLPEYVILDDGTLATWDGAGWDARVADDVALNMGDLVSVDTTLLTLAQLKADSVIGDGQGVGPDGSDGGHTDFASGQFVVVSDGTAHYNNGVWIRGAAV